MLTVLVKGFILWYAPGIGGTVDGEGVAPVAGGYQRGTLRELLGTRHEDVRAVRWVGHGLGRVDRRGDAALSGLSRRARGAVCGVRRGGQPLGLSRLGLGVRQARAGDGGVLGFTLNDDRAHPLRDGGDAGAT